MGKAPEPTDPKETSAASTGTNVSTAIANAFLNNPNEITQDGTKTVDQTGSYSWTDPYTNQTYQVPRFTTTQTLSPQQQAIKDQQDRAKLGLAETGANQSEFLKDYLGKPVDLNNEATEARLMDLGRKRLDPKFADQQASLQTQLSNQGIKLGSTAYQKAMKQFGQTENDAYNQLLLNGRAQATQEALTERNQPINEITALLSGSQVSQPSWAGMNNVTIPTTDNAGIISNYDNQKMAAYQQNQAAIGGLFGGVGNLLGGGTKPWILSDPDAKTDKHKIGETDEGMGLYSFKYKGSNKPQIGLMADEVARKKPSAVRRRPDGLREVNYDAALKKKGKR